MAGQSLAGRCFAVKQEEIRPVVCKGVRNMYKIFIQKLKGRVHFGNVDIDGSILLNGSKRSRLQRCKLGWDSMTGFCEDSNEPSHYIKPV
jgi:hypothetical protein